MVCAVMRLTQDYFPDKNENVRTDIFKQYEKVIFQSIITSFGLDSLIKDHDGGDVDTILNVRKGIYQKDSNKNDYDNRGKYNPNDYHSDKRYKDANNSAKEKRMSGDLNDAYTGEKIAVNDKTNLDHVISGKEIHEDPGRILAGLNGVDLANSPENLQVTNPHTNKTKNADPMDDFLEKHGDEYTDEQKANMKEKDRIARKAYEEKLAKEYYSSPKFAKDLTFAAGKTGIKMGLRQMLGLFFSEVWFAVKEEFIAFKVQPDQDMDIGSFFKAIGNGVKRGFQNAKAKYKELFEKFAEGTVSGIISSLTTSLCNIFFTTAKNVVKIIRQSFSSVVEAAKILLFNPDDLPFGERMRAVMKILATGAAVVLGEIVSEVISKTPVGMIPVIGDIVQTFCGTMCTGIVSCTLLYFLDHSKVIRTAVEWLNKIDIAGSSIQYYKEKAAYFERYAAELMKIDLECFKQETESYYRISKRISSATSDDEINIILKDVVKKMRVKIPWHYEYDSMNSFMTDTDARIVIS